MPSIPGPRDIRRQPQPRVLMGDDRRAGLAQAIVRTSLLVVPMRIEERVNPAAPGQAGENFHQGIGGARRSSIDKQDAVSTGLRDDIGFSRNSYDEHIVAQFQRAGAFGHRLRSCLRKA